MNLFRRAIPLILIFVVSTTVLSSHQTTLQQQGSGGAATAYDRAFRLFQDGYAQEALTEIDAALLKSPHSALLHNLRGLVAAQLGRHEEAENDFRTVIQLLPHSAMGYDNLGALLWQSGRYSEAAALFRNALRHEPNKFTALVGLGATLAALHKYAEAAPYLQRAWSAHPNDFQTGYEWARVLHELKRSQEAEAVLATLPPPQDRAARAKLYVLTAVVAEGTGNQVAATRFYRQAYEIAPQSFDIYVGLVRTAALDGGRFIAVLPPPPTSLSSAQHFALGLLFATRGAYEDAIEHFERTLVMEPTSYAATYNLALADKRAGKPQSAIAVINRALTQNPSAELYNLLASLEEDGGQYVQAVHHYQRAVELEPTNEQYYFDLGAEYLVHLTFEPALEAFRLGTQKFPHSPRQQVGMGLAEFALGKNSDAAEALMSALELDPSAPDAFAAWTSLPPFVITDEWYTLQPRLQQLAERHPRSPEALYCYAAALLTHDVTVGRDSNLSSVQAMLERAIHMNPTLAEAHLALANLLTAEKEYRPAILSFLEAIRLKPDSEVAHYQLGQAYRDLHQLDLAERELAKYSELSHRHRDTLAQTRSAVRQFILAQPGSTAGGENKFP